MTEATKRALEELRQPLAVQPPSDGFTCAKSEPSALSASSEGAKDAIAVPVLPERILTARYPLTVLCRETVSQNPAAGRLTTTERGLLSEAMERAVLSWLVGVFTPEYAWAATCPRGHNISDGVFARQLVGWSCEECKQVYAASECRLRDREPQGNGG